MTRSRALITSVFFASLVGAVGLATYNGREQQSNLVLVEEGTDEPKAAPKIEAKPSVPNAKAQVAGKKIVWESSFENAMQRAKREGKPVFIDFYTDWCHWCKVMDETVYPDQRVIAQSQNWVMVKIDGDKRADVARAYGVTGFPTIVFAENTGKPLEIVPGFAEAPEFVTIMQGAFSKWTPPTSA